MSYALKNKVQLIGKVAKTPEVVITETQDLKMVKLIVTTDDTFHNDKGQKVTETVVHHVIGFGKLAEICEKYIVKGSEIAIEGKLVNRQYEDKLGGKHYVTDVHMSDMLMLGGNRLKKRND